MKGKYSAFEKIEMLLLFLFAVAFLNLSGYIFAGILVAYFFLEIRRIRIGKTEITLLMFGVSYFIFYLYHFPVGINEVIWYMVGPVGAFIIGKLFVRRSKRDEACLKLLAILALGMFIHGFLNWYAYRISHYAVNYKHLRLSVDFWRKELVAVTSTGMLFTFSAAICTGICFSNAKLKEKRIALVILGIDISLSVAFANRTLIIIIAALVVMETLLSGRSLHQNRKAFLKKTIAILLFTVVGCLLFFTDFWQLALERLLNVKLFNRIQSNDVDPRFYTWFYFVKDFNFIKHPFGGDKLLQNGLHLADGSIVNYFHNLWLDVYNIVGLLPTLFLLVFTGRMFNQYKRFANYACITGGRKLIPIMRCWIVAVFLNCCVEPIIEGNPYYFLMMLMCFGAMEAQIGKMARQTMWRKL